MQDIILGRMWADHHQRIYGEAGQADETNAGATPRSAADPLPAAGKAMVLALAASLASLGASLASVGVA